MIELIQAGEEQRELLWNINQKYLYEMTNFYADELDEAGVLHYGHFESYFTDPAREALLLYADGILVGFAMLCPYSQLEEPVDYVMAEFTVFPMYRRRGLALEAAQRILEVRPGRWEIKYNEKNAAAKALWTKLTTPYGPRKTRFSDVETVLQFTINQGRKHNADEVRFDASSLSANYSEKGSLARYQELNSVFPHTLILFHHTGYYYGYNDTAVALNRWFGYRFYQSKELLFAKGDHLEPLVRKFQLRGYRYIVDDDGELTFGSGKGFILKKPLSYYEAHPVLRPEPKPRSTSYTEQFSKNGGGWNDDVWTPGLPSERYFKKR